MTTFAYTSDWHLEMLAHDNNAAGTLRASVVKNQSGADVLILAGDIIEARILTASKESTKYPIKRNTLKIFEELCKAYEKVLYVMGNHEHYRGTLQKTKGIIEDATDHLDNFVVLENEVIAINDVKVFGATFWTDLGGPVNEWFVQQQMNDYKLIKTLSPNYRKLRASDTVNEHINSSIKLKEFLESNKDQKMVVVTHHAPHYNMIHELYRTSTDNSLNHAYYSDQTKLMCAYDNLKAWVSGHTHATIHDSICGT